MTESEARRKWCPFTSRITDYYYRESDREEVEGGKLPADAHAAATQCVASDCMAWRWDCQSRPAGAEVDGYKHNESCHGYCGLAGKP